MTSGSQALRSAAGLLDLAGRGLIAVRGRDRARLLHNLTSNDVKTLTPGEGRYTFLLSPQGRIQADLHLWCFEDRFLIDTEPELGAKVQAHIRRYIVADQVELEDGSGGLGAVAVEGPSAAGVLAAAGAPVPDAPYTHLAWKGAAVAAVSFTGQPGFRIYTPDGAAVRAALQAAGAVPAASEEARALRIENGRPRYGEDIFETSLPQETGQMHGVSFLKGCYLGQEIVERIRARGHVNRRLVRLLVEGAALPAPGSRLTVSGAEVGETASSARSPQGACFALAYVRVPHDASGTELEWEGGRATVAPLT